MNGETAVVKVENEKQIGQMATDYRARVEALKVTSRETYAQMVQLVKESKLFQDVVTEHYEPMRKKTYEAYQEVLAQRKKHLDPFVKAEQIGKQRMRGWEQIEAQRQREAEAKARAKAREAEAAGKPAPIVVPVQNKAHLVEGVQYVDNWVGQVVSLEDLLKAVIAGKAPMTFVQPNEQMIRRFGRETAGKVAIPGIRWQNEKTVRIA